MSVLVCCGFKQNTYRQPRISTVEVAAIHYATFMRRDIRVPDLIAWCKSTMISTSFHCAPITDTNFINMMAGILERIKNDEYPTSMDFTDVRILCLVKYENAENSDTLCFAGNRMSLNSKSYWVDRTFLLALSKYLPDGHQREIEYEMENYDSYRRHDKE